MIHKIVLSVFMVFAGVQGYCTGTVVLLHGMMSPGWTMARVDSYLEEKGFVVHRYEYESRDCSLPENVENLNRYIEEHIPPEDTLHLAGHSMGGLVIQSLISKYRYPNLGKVVLISCPQNGSAKAEFFGDWFLFRWLYGEAGQNLRKSHFSRTDLQLPRDVPVGVIVGYVGGFGLSLVVPGDDDGTVGVEEAELAGATDTFYVFGQHTAILFKDETREQIAAFLNTGRFRHGGTETAVFRHNTGE